MILKMSVLTNNRVLVDGRPVSMGELEEAICTISKEKDSTVWYYREDAAGEGSEGPVFG